jgi:hypothetical protein
MWRALVLLAVACAPPLEHAASASDCASCHAEQHDGWSRSRHGQSLSSPVFQALLPKVELAWGRAARARCVACHSPGHGGDDVITCVSCHGAVGNRGTRNGALVVDLSQPLASAELSVNNGAHVVRPRGLLTSASLCGTCHEVRGPGLLEETTHAELAATVGEDSCTSCHAAKGHRFQGVDPAWSGDEAAQALADQQATALWASGLALSATVSGDQLHVSLTNTSRHAIPTGFAVIRDVWVEVAQGGRAERLIDLRARLERGGEKVALITDADQVRSGSLAVGETTTATVTVQPGAVRVALRARAVRDDVLAALGVDGGRVHTLEVAMVSLDVR